jgi:hypothetical protein
VRGSPARLWLAGPLCAVTAVAVIAVQLPGGRRMLGRTATRWEGPLCGWVVAVAIAATAVQLHVSGNWTGGSPGYSSLAWVGVAHAVLALVLLPAALSGIARGVGRAGWWTAGLFVAVAAAGAAAYAFGSGNGFFAQLNGGIAPFLALALFSVLLLPDPAALGTPLLALTLSMGVGAWMVMADAEARPYRQAPISRQTAALDLGGGRGTLMVSPQIATELDRLRRDAVAAGWRPRTPMLDLSAYAATIPFVLQAQAPLTVIPSVGGYPTQDELARWSIDELIDAGWLEDGWRDAWVLTLVDGRQKGVDPAVLELLGRTFPRDYEPVGTYRFRAETLRLWRPVDIAPPAQGGS